MMTKIMGFLAPVANAATVTPNNNDTTITELVVNFISYFTYLISALALLAVVYAGFLFMTAGGNPDKLSKAKRALIYALVGVLIIAISTIFIKSLQTFMLDEILS